MNGRPLLLHPEATLATSPTRLTALLAAVGAPAALASPKALFTAPIGGSAAAALHTFAAFASPRGRDALLEAAEDLEMPAPATLGGAPFPDLAAIAVGSAEEGDAPWQQAIERGSHRLARALPDRIGYELWARRPLHDEAKAFEGATADLPGATPLAPPWIAEQGAIRWFAIFWTDPSAVRLTLGEDGPRAVADPTLYADLVMIDPDAGRVHIVTHDPRRVAPIVAALGARDLLKRPALTLRALLDGGEDALARCELPARVQRVSVIAAQVLDPAGGRVEARTSSAIADAQAIASARGGYVHRATFRLAIEGAAAPVDAYVELPNRLGVADPRWMGEVREVLAALGVFSPGAMGDDVNTLARGAEAEWRFREVVGEAGVATLRARQLLAIVPRRRAGVALVESMRASGHTLRAFPLAHPRDLGKAYVFADDRAVRARTITDKEREVVALDLLKLTAALREDLGATKPFAPLGEGARALDVGLVAGGRVRVAYLIAPVDEATVATLARAAAPAELVLLCAKGRSGGRPRTVELELAEQFGLASIRAKVDAAIAPFVAELVATKGAEGAGNGVVLSVPGTFTRQRTDVVIDGVRRPVQNRAVLLVLAAIVGRERGAPATVPDGDAQGAWQALWRMKQAFKREGGERDEGPSIVEIKDGALRLRHDVALGPVGWEALAEHPDLRVRELVANRSGKPTGGRRGPRR